MTDKAMLIGLVLIALWGTSELWSLAARLWRGRRARLDARAINDCKPGCFMSRPPEDLQ
jgi:hypothetical protein